LQVAGRCFCDDEIVATPLQNGVQFYIQNQRPEKNFADKGSAAALPQLCHSSATALPQLCHSSAKGIPGSATPLPFFSNSNLKLTALCRLPEIFFPIRFPKKN
jgi:hypothetical protein